MHDLMNIRYVATACVLSLTLSAGVTAQNINPTVMETKQIYRDVDLKDVLPYKGNPYGLVYNNAIMKNEAGKVNIHPIDIQTYYVPEYVTQISDKLTEFFGKNL